MRSKVGAGTVAGLIAGVIFGLIMMFTTVPLTTGGEVSMMEMLAMSVGSTNIWAGWALHLISSAIIGLIFGAIFGNKIVSYKSGLGFGALFGIIWWAVNGLIILPLIGEGVALTFSNLIGYLIFGMALGAIFMALRHRPEKRVRYERREVHA